MGGVAVTVTVSGYMFVLEVPPGQNRVNVRPFRGLVGVPAHSHDGSDGWHEIIANLEGGIGRGS